MMDLMKYQIAMETIVKFDTNFKPKGKKNLSDFKLVKTIDPISPEDAKAGLISHVTYKWMDGNKLVATVGTERWPNNWNSFFNFEVKPDYRGYGLGNQIVQFLKKQGYNHLSVDARNRLAQSIYWDHGFRFSGKETEMLIRMELKEK